MAWFICQEADQHAVGGGERNRRTQPEAHARPVQLTALGSARSSARASSFCRVSARIMPGPGLMLSFVFPVWAARSRRCATPNSRP